MGRYRSFGVKQSTQYCGPVDQHRHFAVMRASYSVHGSLFAVLPQYVPGDIKHSYDSKSWDRESTSEPPETGAITI